MEHHYGTVIIGAGPAGIACGIAMLQRFGKPCIIDKAVFPRNKTCAGLVTRKTYALLRKLYRNEPPEDLFCDAVSEVKLFRRKELLAAAPLQRPVRLVDRTRFDDKLMRKYRISGGKLIEGEPIQRIDYDHQRIRLSNGEFICYQTLVLADGALSLSRQFTGIEKSDLAIGVETYLPRSVLPVDSVELYFDYLNSGYVWAFPHGDTVCVGAADRFRRDMDYRRILSGFLRDKGIDPAGAQYLGAFLPYGKAADQRLLPPNVLAVGDAAGLADPISGEGLYMALLSGICAAGAMDKPVPVQAYLQGIQPLLKIVKEGRRVQRAFYAPVFHDRLLQRVRDNSRAVSFYFENMVEQYRYDYHNLPRLYRDYQQSKHR